MAKTPLVDINPNILEWARKSIGFSIEDLANKLKVKVDKVTDWEKGNEKPTFAQLRNVASALKRPSSLFFLKDVPEEEPLPKDFRIITEMMDPELSHQTLIEIRRMRRKRDGAFALAQELGWVIPEFRKKATLNDDVEELARLVREQFIDISLSEQKGMKDTNEFFNALKSKFESLGILVFQSNVSEIFEFRGITLYYDQFPAIVINSKDALTGKGFSMLHELCHVMLGQSGICNMEPVDKNTGYINQIELYCNDFAGAFLVPKSCIEADMKGAGQITLSLIDNIAPSYKVSSEVYLRRLLKFGYVTKSEFFKLRETLIRRYKDYRKSMKGKPIVIPQSRKVISSNGDYFTQLILSSYYSNKINIQQLSDFLNVKTKHLSKIENELGRKLSG